MQLESSGVVQKYKASFFTLCVFSQHLACSLSNHQQLKILSLSFFITVLMSVFISYKTIRSHSDSHKTNYKKHPSIVSNVHLSVSLPVCLLAIARVFHSSSLISWFYITLKIVSTFHVLTEFLTSLQQKPCLAIRSL